MVSTLVDLKLDVDLRLDLPGEDLPGEDIVGRPGLRVVVHETGFIFDLSISMRILEGFINSQGMKRTLDRERLYNRHVYGSVCVSANVASVATSRVVKR